MCTNLASISEKIGKLPLEQLARQSGFIRSTPQKIQPKGFILSFMLCIGSLRISLSDWANSLMKLSGISVSKQAIDQRTAGSRHVEFAASTLQASISQQLARTKTSSQASGLLAPFNRVLIEDSCCITLPRCLWTLYEGAHNNIGNKTASARVQLAVDMKEGQVVSADLKGYRNNDQSYSAAIVERLQAKDLVVRDQGYFVLDAFAKIAKADAYFLSRLKPNINVYEPGSTQPIDLLNLCQSKAKQRQYTFELWVELGAKNRLPVRLIVQRVPKEIFKQRKRKAAKNRHKKANHSKRYLALLEWQILITNAPVQDLPTENAYKIYRLRWHIEILFKCWKSHFKIQALMISQKRIKATRAQIIIYLYLTYLAIMFMGRYMQMARLIYHKTSKLLSITKWARIVATHNIDLSQDPTPQWIAHLARATTYEQRKDRTNHLQLMWEHLFA